MGAASQLLEPVGRLEGVLDGRDAPAVRDALYAAVAAAEPGSVCVLDVSHATLVDLTVLRAVAVASRHAERNGVRVVLRGGSAAARRCAQLAGLSRWIHWDRSPGGDSLTSRR